MGLSDVLKLVEEFRKSDASTPVVLMGYANPIEAMGVGKFVAAAKAAGVEEEEVLEALESGRAYSSLALSQGTGQEDGE